MVRLTDSGLTHFLTSYSSVWVLATFSIKCIKSWLSTQIVNTNLNKMHQVVGANTKLNKNASSLGSQNYFFIKSTSHGYQHKFQFFAWSHGGQNKFNKLHKVIVSYKHKCKGNIPSYCFQFIFPSKNSKS